MPCCAGSPASPAALLDQYGSSPRANEGRLTVFNGSVWRPVAATTGANLTRIAELACNDLAAGSAGNGSTTSNSTASWAMAATTAYWPGQHLKWDIACTSSETSLSQCRFTATPGNFQEMELVCGGPTG